MSPACTSLVVYKARWVVDGAFLLSVGRLILTQDASTIDIIVL
jgi:hypothetical protein